MSRVKKQRKPKHYGGLVLEVGHRCPKLADEAADWQEFDLHRDSDAELFVFECPKCKQRACINFAMAL